LKRLHVLFFLIFGCSLVAPVTAQKLTDGAVSTTPVISAPYRVGERLTYNVSFANFINAAHIEIFVAARGNFLNRDGIQLRAHVETTEFVNAALYAMNNDYTSFIDPHTGQPYRAQQTIREGGRTSDISNDYNLPLGTDAFPPKRTGGFAGTYDLLSALYRVRALPLADGASYSFTARNGNDQYDVEVKVIGHEMVKTSVGSFNTIVTQIRSQGNSQINDRRIRIYFSDDQRHVPVLITLKERFGEIRADLAGSEFVNTPGGQSPPSKTVTPNPTPTPPPVTAVPASDGQPELGLPFKVGEQLNYNVYLATESQPVAVASFQVKPRAKYFNKDGLLLTGAARTNGIVARVFTANDVINSYVDPSTLLPFKSEQKLQEGKRQVSQVITTDQDRGAVMTDTGQRIEIPVGTHDMLSVLYALRSFNLAPPKRNAVSLLVNNRPLTLFVTSLGRERIKINGQDIPAIQLSLTTDDPQSDKFNIRMWIGDDRRRIPLRVTANTELGPVRADLAIIPTSEQ
jgi:hypothetical protein